MILIEREDVDRLIPLGLPKMPFYVRWEIGDPIGEILDYPDVLSPGPFVAIVTDDEAWVGTSANRLCGVAPRRADRINYRIWAGLADLYVAEMGISRQGFIKRFAAMNRFLGRNPGQWIPWEEAYHWPDERNLAWSSVSMDSSIKTREHEGQRQVRYR